MVHKLNESSFLLYFNGISFMITLKLVFHWHYSTSMTELLSPLLPFVILDTPRKSDPEDLSALQRRPRSTWGGWCVEGEIMPSDSTDGHSSCTRHTLFDVGHCLEMGSGKIKWIHFKNLKICLHKSMKEMCYRHSLIFPIFYSDCFPMKENRASAS